MIGKIAGFGNLFDLVLLYISAIPHFPRMIMNAAPMAEITLAAFS